MVRQGVQVPLEKSDIRRALDIAKMVTAGFSSAAIEETQQLIKKPRSEVREEKKWEIQCSRHKELKAAIERHPAMVYTNHKDWNLPCPNATPKNPQTRWRWKGTGAPPQEPEASLLGTPPPPGMPPAPPGETDRHESYEIEGMPSRCVYIHSPHPNTLFFNLNTYAMNSKPDTDFIPDLLSTLSAAWKYCWHWFWRRQQPVERTWEWRRELIEMNGSFQYYHYLQLANT